MKRLLLLFYFFSVSSSLYAQWSGTNILSFDSGDPFFHHLIIVDTIHYHHNIWQIGKPNKTVFTSAYSLPNAIVTDTLNPYPANDTSVFILKMPFTVPLTGLLPYALTYGISFSYQLRKDLNSISRLEVSQDNGTNWYDIKDTLPSAFSWLHPWDTDNLSDTTLTWRQFNLNVTAPHFSFTDTFLFRFTFISDSVFANRDGWIIDNIALVYYTEGVTQIQNNKFISINPNPATTSLTISSTAIITQLTISNLLGQTVYTHEYNTEKAQVDVADLPTGIYLIKINGIEVRKFVKE